MRNPFLLIASAVQGGGKSVETVRQMLYQAYVSKHKRSGILYDTNNEFGSVEIDGVIHKIQTITVNELVSFGNNPKTEVRRIVPFHPNGQPMDAIDSEKLLMRVLKETRNCTLLIEDLNTIYGDALPVSISGLLCNVRHRNCDVIFHIQSVGRLLPKILQNCKIIRYHYQLDSVSDSAGKLSGEIEIFSIAEQIVNKKYEEGDIRFFVYIYRETKKIKGNFSPKMFSEAIQRYISDNPKTTANLEKRRDANGKKMLTYEQAVEIKTLELFKKYYGNVLPGAAK
jgi:hypothetical protein